MPLRRSDELQPAVLVFLVMPGRKLAGIDQCCKAFVRVIRPVLARPEDRLSIGIIVTDPGAAIGRHDTQSVQDFHQRRAFHRAAVVRVQNKVYAGNTLT